MDSSTKEEITTLSTKIDKLVEIISYQNNKMKEQTQSIKDFTETMALRTIKDFIVKSRDFETHVKFDEDIGCGSKFFFQYFKGKMDKSSMIFNDTRTWNLGFRIPLKHFDLTKREEWLSAVHYTNILPFEKPQKDPKITEEEVVQFMEDTVKRREHDRLKLGKFSKEKEKDKEWMIKSLF